MLAPMASGLCDSFAASLIAHRILEPIIRPGVDAPARAEGIDLDHPRILEWPHPRSEPTLLDP